MASTGRIYGSQISRSEIRTLANLSQARKRARQAEKRRLQNRAQRSMLRSHIKKVLKATQKTDKAHAESVFREAVPVIDRLAARGLIHKNKAARHKSRLNKRLRALG
jgi:small subunit ribosomal protein S20